MGRVRMPSPAMIVALVALASSLAGGAYAQTLKRNSVRSKQIARNAVKSPDIAPNAAKGVDVNEATLGLVPNADRLDGLDSTALVRSFAGHIAEFDSGVVFSVPELEVAILGDTQGASSNAFRVRNDSGDDVLLNELILHQEALDIVDPNSTSANQNEDGPFLLIAKSHPDLALVFGCANAAQLYCFGQLMRAPAGG